MIVDHDLCLHCGACVGACPINAMFLHETSTIVFLPACTECGLCAVVCPVGAIDAGPGEPVPPVIRPESKCGQPCVGPAG